MEEEHREWWLFGIMAALIVAVALVAWNDVPPLTPPTVTYHSAVSDKTTANGVSNGGENSGGKISINTATAEELMQLNGVGETIAQRILTYREAHGPFEEVEELLNVQGIGEKRLAEWLPYLTL